MFWLSVSAVSDYRRSFPLYFPYCVAVRSLFCCTIRKLTIPVDRIGDLLLGDYLGSLFRLIPIIGDLFHCISRTASLYNYCSVVRYGSFMLLCTITACTSRHGNYFHWYHPWSRHGQYRRYRCTITPRGAVDQITETVRDQMCTVSGSIGCSISPRGAVDLITETVRDQMRTISGSISSGRFLLNPEFSG